MVLIFVGLLKPKGLYGIYNTSSNLCMAVIPPLKVPIVNRVNMLCEVHIGMYLHGFEKHILPDINKQSSLGEEWEQGEA